MSSEKSKVVQNKSVRFAANVRTSTAAHRRHQRDDDDDDNYGRRKKRPRLERPNEDEADDVDDWEGEEEDVDEGVVPKTKELLDAKRKRRERQHGEDIEEDEEEDDTHIDAQTSLMSENMDAKNEVAVEPFNMDAEQQDGSGYFDGDTYVFRKRDAEEEPDAWLESLSDNKEVASIPERMDVEEEGGGTSMDDWSKEDLFAKIVPLVSDSESVLQAVTRYGGLLKRHKKNKGSSDVNDASVQTAQRALNDLTEAANALLLKGDVDIYQRTRTDLMKVLPDTKPSAIKQDEGKDKVVVSWEYRGNQDGQIHGPYTTAQMLSWIQAGYFIGAQAVQIRTIRQESQEDKSMADDLLSDLMDDEDDKVAEPKLVKGKWRSSNDVDFTSYA